MGDSTVIGLIWLVFLVAPGLLFDLLRERRLPTVQESAFRESSRVVLSGVIFNVLAVLVLRGVAIAGGPPTPDGRLWVADPRSYVVMNFDLVKRFIILELLLSLVFAFVTHVLLMRGAITRIKPVTGWHNAIRGDAPAGSTPAARVKLDDGTVYVGAIGAFTTGDVAPDEREIVLRSPIWAKAPNERNLISVPREWQEVVLSGSRIKSLAVAYWTTREVESERQSVIKRISGWVARRV